MENNIFRTVRNAIKHWYLFLLIGLIFIITGVYTFTKPLEAYITLSIIFSISFLVSGISEIAFAITNKNEIHNWGWSLVFGILTFIVGIMLIMNPAISITTLPFYVGFLVMFRAINAISYAIDLKSYGVLDWGNLLVLGILGLLFAFILLWNPLFAGLSIVVWTAIAFITIGVYNVYLSLKMKKLKNN
ncbi:MAG: DUF308 domain-containing protein [Chitinophagales bacterium]|nr:DUF308 domain-containing protein [Chitinophagales bacterium]